MIAIFSLQLSEILAKNKFKWEWHVTNIATRMPRLEENSCTTHHKILAQLSEISQHVCNALLETLTSISNDLTSLEIW